MLTKWQLGNFKPVNGPKEITLKEVTVFAGLNSSGKSSVLQSILLLVQTLNNQNPDKPLILNGNIVQLGTFDNIHNDQTTENYVIIGFDLTLEEQHRGPTKTSRIGYLKPFIPESRLNIKLSSKFNSAAASSSDLSGIEAVRVALLESNLTVNYEPLTEHGKTKPPYYENRPKTVSTEIRVMAQSEQADFISDVKGDFLRLVPYPNSENYKAIFSEKTINHQSEIWMVRLNHFLPDRFVGKFKIEERRRKETTTIVENLFDGISYYSAYSPSSHQTAQQILSHILSNRVKQQIQELCKPKQIQPFSGNIVRELIEWTWALTLKTNAKFNFKKKMKQFVINDYIPGPEPGCGLENVSNNLEVTILENATQHIINFFGTMIRYIGPLRADPQAAQGFAPSSEPDDVGIKGEFAASVYDANRKQKISWWDPEQKTLKENFLDEAVDFWVRYLGVAHHVSTREAGISGVSWMVQSLPSVRERPLQSVGIGVSQILPILVAGLLAPKGAVILIEQPELHLHARAQSRLGDFLLGLAKTQKQCVIETHSDCLVNQLRYRMVQEGQMTQNMVSIYFVEQNETGDARFTPIKISSRGNIENWPDGFFDESIQQEDKITQESILRK